MNKKENPLYLHAERELKLAGLDKPEADYGGALYKAVLDLVETFCGEGHSGMSAEMTLAIFDRVARWKTLSPITNNPEEWTKVTDDLWQNKRSPSHFSKDGGETWQDVDEK